MRAGASRHLTGAHGPPPLAGFAVNRSGMDVWGFVHSSHGLRRVASCPWSALLRHRRPDARARVVSRRRSRSVAPTRRPRRGPAPLRGAPAPPRVCGRTGSRRRAAQHHPAPARPPRSRRYLDLPAGHRPRRDRRDHPRVAAADDPGPAQASSYGREPRLSLFHNRGTLRLRCCFAGDSRVLLRLMLVREARSGSRQGSGDTA
jgi:hypothetical protein